MRGGERGKGRSSKEIVWGKKAFSDPLGVIWNVSTVQENITVIIFKSSLTFFINP